MRDDVPPAAGHGLEPAVPVPVPFPVPVAVPDPDLDDPRLAAARYRALFAELAAARSKLDERTRAGQDQRGAQARRHREAAEMIRDRVSEVWEAVGPPLAQHGVSDLDQLRPESVAGGSGALVVADVEPKKAVKDAHDQCMEAMAKAAELRAVSRASASTSAGLVAGAACVLVGVGAALARQVFATPAGACLAVGAVVVWLAVSAFTDGGRLVAVRAGLVGAGTAGLAVLATLRAVPGDTVGVAGALVAVAVAIRFGFGVGSGTGAANGNGNGGRGSGGRGGERRR